MGLFIEEMRCNLIHEDVWIVYGECLAFGHPKDGSRGGLAVAIKLVHLIYTSNCNLHATG